jgi:hypothetical protein
MNLQWLFTCVPFPSKNSAYDTCTLSKPCKNVLINWGVPMFTKVHHVETIPSAALGLWSG